MNRRIIFLATLTITLLSCTSIPFLGGSDVKDTPPPIGFETSPPAENVPIDLSTGTPEPIPTLAQAPFRIQQTPAYTRNFAHPEQGCMWLGVAGQVFDKDGSALEEYVLVVEGEIKEQRIEALGLTGGAKAYGAGGYEIVLGYMPVNSDQQLSITLYDLAGNQLSDPYRFLTFSDCVKNLLVINFQERSDP